MIATALSEVRERAAAAARRSGRHPDEVTIVAVSKAHPVSAILEAHDAGQRVFGESRAQELVAKAHEAPSDIHWHFIGPLQRNKVRLVRPVVRLLHSMDRLPLASVWGGGPPALLQIRMGGEETKHGVDPPMAAEVADAMAKAGVRLVGLMTIPPPVTDPDDARPWFARLRALRDELAVEMPSLRELSMGMSHDYEVAIEEGATIIRVGSAIFGPR